MKKLKILLGNNTLSFLGGSETWTYTLARAFKNSGHYVDCFSPELGIISDELLKENILSFKELSPTEVKPFSFVLEEKSDFNYDIIIANHNHIVDYLRSLYPRTPIISTVHGIIHFFEDKKTWAPEHPATESGVNQFISVSEEIKEKLLAEYNIDSFIIRNFIDIERYSVKPINEKPKQILINTNYFGKDDAEIEIIRKVAKHYGAKLAALGVNFTPSFYTEKAIQDSDIVVGVGRSILEGMSMGRLAIVHGRWGSAGVINKDNVEEIRKFNFSGRNSGGNLLSAEQLIEQIDKYYTPEQFEWNRNYICENHNANFAADVFIRLARELTGEYNNKIQ